MKKRTSQMKMGRTIVAERERIESESERMHARKKLHRKKFISVIVALLLVVVLVVILAISFSKWQQSQEKARIEAQTFEPTVNIIDEGNGGITSKVKNYVGKIEQDLSSLGYKVSRAVLPQGKMREINIYLEGKDYYFKTQLDRGTAVTAEDISRMVRYLDEKGIAPAEYVDVRVERKAYYK